jgi:hypothetical protein
MAMTRFCQADDIRTHWKQSTAERYDYALEVVPPAAMTGLGFLVGEPALCLMPAQPYRASRLCAEQHDLI